MRDIVITDLVVTNDRHKGGNIRLASFDFAICGMIEFSGATLVKYQRGNLTEFVPQTITKDGRVIGARFPDQELRSEIATAALTIYKKMGGRLGGEEPAPPEPIAASIIELPAPARPRGLARWLKSDEIGREKARGGAAVHDDGHDHDRGGAR